MAALGHKRRFCDAGAMSALPPKADIRCQAFDVCFVPIADIAPMPTNISDLPDALETNAGDWLSAKCQFQTSVNRLV